MTDRNRLILFFVISALILFGYQSLNNSYYESKDVNKNKLTILEKEPLLHDKEAVVNSEKINVSNAFNSNYTLEKDFLKVSIDNNLCVVDYISTNVSASKVFNSKKLVCFNFNNLDYKSLSFTKNNQSLKVLKNDKPLLNFSLVDNQLNFEILETLSTIDFYSSEIQLENGQINKFVYYDESLSTIDVGDDERGDNEIRWMGLDFNFHLFAVDFGNHKRFISEFYKSGKATFVANSAMDSTKGRILFVKKNYDDLLLLGGNLEESIDFGIWKILAVLILRGLQFFYSLIPNWGIAIILLTVIIRTLLFPLQFKSFKSMKRMQDIQPELTKVREKYKQDPQRMQAETMKLFKKAGANPLGGCLPMLLQMPVFFAFYKVLYSSVELVGANFILWISDLSVKDPYYILPILMGLAMFLHQKLTPSSSTMEPAQQKILMLMPLAFSFFMKDLPAGLSLYIFISTILGLMQQMLVFKKLK